MNKKGMTLVEIILVVALLGLLAVLISVNATAMLNKEKDKKKTEREKRIENACQTYCSLSKYKESDFCQVKDHDSINVQVLCNEGLLAEEDCDMSLYNSYKSSDVVSEIKNGEFICHIDN